MGISSWCVRQVSVRQQNTKYKAGSLPLEMYYHKLPDQGDYASPISSIEVSDEPAVPEDNPPVSVSKSSVARVGDCSSDNDTSDEDIDFDHDSSSDEDLQEIQKDFTNTLRVTSTRTRCIKVPK